MTYTRERLGELLLASGRITEGQLAEALAVQADEGGKIGQVLVRQLVLDEDLIARTLAEQKGLQFISLTTYPVDREAVARIPERVARRCLVIPVGYKDGAIVLAMADPLDIEAIEDVRVRTNMPVQPVVATSTQIQYAIEKYITSADAFSDVMIAVEEEEGGEVEIEADDDVPVVRLVNQLIREAVIDQASDVHIEPGDKSIRVRYRVDGVLHEVMQLPLSVKAGVISRVKIMAEMNIAERRRPQDGRISIVVNGRGIDLRVATLPTPSGESIVIRVLNHDMEMLTLEDLGMAEKHLRQMERFLARPYGAILVSGRRVPGNRPRSTRVSRASTRRPEDSHDRGPHRVPDPGHHADGREPVIGLTFARLLRTVLRSDPDVVMVGEIRDAETAEIAVRAALTGHLMLSSIHTNDAPSALTRLVDMEVAPYITSSALVGIVAQRLPGACARSAAGGSRSATMWRVPRLLGRGDRGGSQAVGAEGVRGMHGYRIPRPHRAL